jgi:alpha-glucosidase
LSTRARHSIFSAFFGAGLALAVIAPAPGWAFSLDGQKPIGDVSRVARAGGSLLIDCTDRSQVQLSPLAPDLIRVRASFGRPLPAPNHSWAIEKTDWVAPRWTVRESPAEIVVVTDEIEVAVRRAPLLIEFRDVKTHRPANRDARPMSFAAKTGVVADYKRLGFDEHFYGLGEKAAPLDKRRGGYTMWNTDTSYQEGTDPLYQSVPFYLGWEAGQVYGIFFDTSYRAEFDMGKTQQEYVSFSAETSPDDAQLDYYFFWGPSMKKVVSRYADLTGHMPLPPRWALGHQQSRWSYYPDTTVEALVDRYRADDLPLDVVYLDIDYMDDYRVFTWSPRTFPDPRGLIARVGRQGVKVITIVDPGVKYQPQQPGYRVFDEGMAHDFFLRRRSGALYVGAVWPGPAVFTDYTKETARHWWGDLHHVYTDVGVAGIWNDMNEPSDFVDKSGKSQVDVVSDDGGTRSPYAKNRNVFGTLMSRATYEGLQRLAPDKRPFVLTRAGSAGIQRYAATWTGDNASTWEHLALTLPMLQSLGLAGQPFVGADIGGFFGRSNGELLARWYQAAFLVPFCRNHKNREANDQEPWRFGTHVEAIIRKYLKLRYRLLPFLYTVLEEAHRTGVPMFRPVLLNYPTDPDAVALDDELMVGDDLLVAPVLRPGAESRLVYLPEGVWIDYWTGARHAGRTTLRVAAPLDTVPLFVRAGAVIPTGPEMSWIGEKAVDPLTFEIYPDDHGQARGTLYEDDGTSSAYLTGTLRRTEIRVEPKGGVLRATLSTSDNHFDPGPGRVRYVVRGTGKYRTVVPGARGAR